MRTLTPEREALKHHAITLRKMGWTERAIAEEVGLSKTAIHKYLVSNNLTGVRDQRGPAVSFRPKAISDQKPQIHTFLGPLEEFDTDIRFPLLMADPPWNISVANSMNFTFVDKQGRQHKPLQRNFGAWDFQGDQEAYLTNVEKWLQKLYELGAEDSWCWFWCSYRYLSHINNIAQSVGWQDKGWFVWAKTNAAPLTATINGTAIPALEPCLTLRKGAARLKTNKTGFPNYHLSAMVGGKERLQDSENIAAKPEGLLFDIIEWCTKPGDWILDAFAGTGSATRAAVQKGRNSFAVEMDKRQLTLIELHCEETYGTTPARQAGQ